MRACNQLGQFLQHRETNLRYLAPGEHVHTGQLRVLHEAVRRMRPVINALKAKRPLSPVSQAGWELLVGSGSHTLGPWVVLLCPGGCAPMGTSTGSGKAADPAVRVEMGSKPKKEESEMASGLPGGKDKILCPCLQENSLFAKGCCFPREFRFQSRSSCFVSLFLRVRHSWSCTSS